MCSDHAVAIAALESSIEDEIMHPDSMILHWRSDQVMRCSGFILVGWLAGWLLPKIDNRLQFMSFPHFARILTNLSSQTKVLVTESWLLKISRFGRMDIVAINDAQIHRSTVSRQWQGGEQVLVNLSFACIYVPYLLMAPTLFWGNFWL